MLIYVIKTLDTHKGMRHESVESASIICRILFEDLECASRWQCIKLNLRCRRKLDRDQWNSEYIGNILLIIFMVFIPSTCKGKKGPRKLKESIIISRTLSNPRFVLMELCKQILWEFIPNIGPVNAKWEPKNPAINWIRLVKTSSALDFRALSFFEMAKIYKTMKAVNVYSFSSYCNEPLRN